MASSFSPASIYRLRFRFVFRDGLCGSGHPITSLAHNIGRLLVAQAPTANIAVCHAAFHHVLGRSGLAQDVGPHDAHRIEVLRIWRQKLAPTGRLIVADVPPPGTSVGKQFGTIQSSSPDTDFIASRSGAVLWPPLQSVLGCLSIDDYLTTLDEVLKQHRVSCGDPATFFDQFVANESASGHFGLFASPEHLMSLFEAAGFSNVSCVVVPTPWLFATRREAIWFVHELLGLGNPCTKPEKLRRQQVEIVSEGISRHLGLHAVAGACLLSWNLMFVVGDNI